MDIEQSDSKTAIIDIDQFINLNAFLKGKKSFESLFIEIGFGPDRFFIDRAKENSLSLFMGIEIKKKRILKANAKIIREGADNAFVIWGEAKRIMESFFKDESVCGVYINFPDPFHKKRHYKRRLITVEFIKILYNKLLKSGFFIIITDNEPYMDHIMETADDIKKKHDLPLKFNYSAGMPDNYPMTEFALRNSKGKGIIQYLYAVKEA